MNSTNLKCEYIITAFFFGIENSLTIFELHPSDMAKNVHPYIASFSFWSQCNLFPKYGA